MSLYEKIEPILRVIAGIGTFTGVIIAIIDKSSRIKATMEIDPLFSCLGIEIPLTIPINFKIQIINRGQKPHYLKSITFYINNNQSIFIDFNSQKSIQHNKVGLITQNEPFSTGLSVLPENDEFQVLLQRSNPVIFFCSIDFYDGLKIRSNRIRIPLRN